MRLGAERRQVVTVPRNAVGPEGYALVWDDNRTTLRAVTLGSDLSGGRVEVVSGLAPGEQVVRAPHERAHASARPRVGGADLPRRAELHRQGPDHPQVFPLPSGRGDGHAVARRPTGRGGLGRLAEQGLKIGPAALEKFAGKLKAMGLCERSLEERSIMLMERLRAERRQRLKPRLFQGDILRIRWSVGDPDELLNRWVPRFGFLFTRAGVIAAGVMFALYFVVLGVKWPEYLQALHRLFSFDLGTVGLMYVAFMFVAAIHELGHGFTCKYFGGQVHEIGAMLLYFEPAFFCNVNDAWTFPERRARLWVTAAGSWIQLVLASVAAIVWWAMPPGSLLSDFALGRPSSWRAS